MKKEKTIFIIDDDEDDRDVFCDAVKNIDPTIKSLTACNGLEALQIISQLKQFPDYIFLDLNMPRLGGLQCLSQLKQNEATRHIPVFIYSTSQRREDIEEAKRLGAEKFLTKPALYDEIVVVIASALGYARVQ